jgi:CBS domain-containing protein
MYSERVRNVIEQGKTLVAPPQMAVQAAAELMAKKKAGAIMVVDGDRLIGIFTERDIAFRVVAKRRDPQATLLAEVMTRDPVTVGPDELFGRALHLMHEHHFRHLPVIEDGRPIGIISARSALDPEMEEFVSEAQRRRSLQPGRKRP